MPRPALRPLNTSMICCSEAPDLGSEGGGVRGCCVNVSGGVVVDSLRRCSNFIAEIQGDGWMGWSGLKYSHATWNVENQNMRSTPRLQSAQSRAKRRSKTPFSWSIAHSVAMAAFPLACALQSLVCLSVPARLWRFQHSNSQARVMSAVGQLQASESLGRLGTFTVGLQPAS